MAPNSNIRWLITGYAFTYALSVVFGQVELLGGRREGLGRVQPFLIDGDIFGPTLPPQEKPNVTGSCMEVFQKNEGRLASPNFPVANYPSDANCSWEILVEEGKLIKLNFEYMDMEMGPLDCPFDGVMIIDYGDMWGVNITPTFIGPVAEGIKDPQVNPTVLGNQRYCGNELFDPVMSISNKVHVIFYSDSDSESSGFVLSWTAVDLPKEYRCNFEDGFCEGWINIDTIEDVFDWEIGSGETKTKNTGPLADHTTGTDGKYAFIEASKPRVHNDTAILASPELEFETGEMVMCVQFWYNMFGSHAGHLVVGTAAGEKKIMNWMISGNQGRNWIVEAINIPRIEGPFRIMFVGVRGDGYEGDIAIDDIEIRREPCSVSGVMPKEGLIENGTEAPIEPPTGSYNGSCTLDEWACMASDKCVKEDLLCNDVEDCPLGDDEARALCDDDATTAVMPPAVPTDYLAETTEMDFSTAAEDTTIAEEITAMPATTEADREEETTIVDAMTTIATEETTRVDDVTTENDDVTTLNDDITTANDDVTTSNDMVTTSNDMATTIKDDVTTIEDDITTAGVEVTTVSVHPTTMLLDVTTKTVEPIKVLTSKTVPNEVITTLAVTTESTTTPSTTTSEEETDQHTTEYEEYAPVDLKTTTTTIPELTTFNAIVVGGDSTTELDYEYETTKISTVPPETTTTAQTLRTTSTEQAAVDTVRITSTTPVTSTTDVMRMTSSKSNVPTTESTTTHRAIVTEKQSTVKKTEAPVTVTRDGKKAEPEKVFTPRPSADFPELITGKLENSTGVAEKQQGGDGSSAWRISVFRVQYLAQLLSSLVLVQWLIGGR